MHHFIWPVVLLIVSALTGAYVKRRISKKANDEAYSAEFWKSLNRLVGDLVTKGYSVRIEGSTTTRYITVVNPKTNSTLLSIPTCITRFAQLNATLKLPPIE